MIASFFIVLICFSGTQKVTHKTFFDIEINGYPAGRITFGLFGKITPLTVENFFGLCIGKHGKTDAGVPLHYENSLFHSVIPHFMVQGGDFENFDGTGGQSIFGYPFKDENFLLKHDSEGLLTMMNSGPNTNKSVFAITLDAASFLDDRHVVFGKVLKGLDVIKQIEALGTKEGAVNGVVRIVKSGELLDIQ